MFTSYLVFFYCVTGAVKNEHEWLMAFWECSHCFSQVWKVKKAFKIQVFWKGGKPTFLVCVCFLFIICDLIYSSVNSFPIKWSQHIAVGWQRNLEASSRSHNEENSVGRTKQLRCTSPTSDTSAHLCFCLFCATVWEIRRVWEENRGVRHPGEASDITSNEITKVSFDHTQWFCNHLKQGRVWSLDITGVVSLCRPWSICPTCSTRCVSAELCTR